MARTVRSTGSIKLLGWGAVAVLGALAVYWVNLHWNRVPVGGGLVVVGIPGAFARAGLLEVISGHPFMTLASRWDQLAGWQRGVLGMIVVALAFVLMMCGLVLFG
jgi:hypothetical protein